MCLDNNVKANPVFFPLQVKNDEVQFVHLFLSSIASQTVIVNGPQSFCNDCSCEVSDTLLQFVEQLPSGEYTG